MYNIMLLLNHKLHFAWLPIYFVCQAESTGKSQMAIEKMVEGRLRKYFEEVVLMEQKYFLNDSLSIKVFQVLSVVFKLILPTYLKVISLPYFLM